MNPVGNFSQHQQFPPWQRYRNRNEAANTTSSNRSNKIVRVGCLATMKITEYDTPVRSVKHAIGGGRSGYNFPTQGPDQGPLQVGKEAHGPSLLLGGSA